MKPRDKKGVVDSALNVYGVQGLKVAGMLFTFAQASSDWTHNAAQMEAFVRRM